MAAVTPAELNQWKKEFARNICCDPTTQRTWQEIEGAGIACEALFLLFWYAKGDFAVKEFANRNRGAVKVVGVALRARRMAEAKKGDPREALFVKRAQTKINTVADQPWINPHSPYRTLANAAAMMGNPTLDELPDVMAKRGEAVRRSGTTPELLILRLYAKKHGVRMGLKRLVALAGCANINRLEDVQNLSRFFNRSDVWATAPLLLADFESYLPQLKGTLQALFSLPPPC